MRVKTKSFFATAITVVALFSAIASNTITVDAGYAPSYLMTHPYAIFVNRISNCVTVYGLDEGGNYSVPVKAFACSVGRDLNDTPTGVYQTSDYYVWRKLFGNTYGRYAIRFNGHVLFHSVPYSAPTTDSLITNAYNNLGQSASAGCVRLSVTDEKWLYDNCKAGTTVVVYDDATNPGPLGKPGTLKINPTSAFAKYDPADCNYANIGGSTGLFLRKDYADNNLHVYRFIKDEDFGALVGMYDSNGREMGAWEYKLVVDGEFDTSQVGTYRVSITGRDNAGNTATGTYTMIVE